MDISLLKRKSFFLLSFGSFVSMLGTLIQQFALSLYVLNTTGSGAMFATVIAAGTIPRLLFGPFGGVLADKLDRKKTFVSLDFASGILTLVYAVLYVMKGQLSFIEILIYVMLLQIINAFFEPAISTVVPSILEKDELMNANAFLSTMRQVASVLSPVLAGGLYGQFGLFIVMLINGISFLCSGVSELFIDMPPMEVEDKRITLGHIKDDFKIGIDFIKGSRVVLGVLFLGVFVNFAFSAMFSVLLPYAFIQNFGISEAEYGTYTSVVFIGMIIGPALGAAWSKHASTERIILVGMTITSLMMLGLGVYTSTLMPEIFHTPMRLMVGTGVFMFISCMLIAIINVCMSTHFQKIVPLEVMGRVGSVFSTLIMASSPFGQILFGAMLEMINPSIGFAFTALFGFIGVSGFWYLTRDTKAEALQEAT